MCRYIAARNVWLILFFLLSNVFIEGNAWSENSTSDDCYKERGGIFPCSSTITGNLILMIFYGALLGVAAKLISDGAELLLDLGLSPSLVGGIVLPILGAVPDSAIIVASGLGNDAQDKLSVGMGTLAGSTVMLLTIAWASSLLVGKCDLNSKGESIDQSNEGKFSLVKQGITLYPEIRSGVIIMLVTSTLYIVVQSADWYWSATKRYNQPAYVKDAAMATMILCIIGLIAYIVYSIFDSKRNERLAKLHKQEIIQRRVLHAMLTLVSRQAFKSNTPEASTSTDGVDATDGSDADEHAVSKKYFKAWHMRKGMRSLGERLNSEEETEPMMDKESTAVPIEKEPAEEEEESKKTIAIKCVSMLLGGVALVTIFADPMCSVLTSVTSPKSKSYIPIPAFYVSFVVTPFCSNASELVSSLVFASKKTRENVTMTYSQLFGAATMNNTMCLAIFMALVYVKDLEWIYGAEVICIMAVQWIVGVTSLFRTYKVWMAFPIILTYFICLLIVWLLKNKAHWF